MGTPSDPTEPDYENGNECTECVDTIFNGHTPKYVKATPKGVEPCPPVEELPDGFGDAILRQRAVGACHWSVSVERAGKDHDYDWLIDTGAADESTFTYDIDGVGVFSGKDTETCIAAFDNLLTCAAADAVEGGTVGITWGPEINQEAYDAQF